MTAASRFRARRRTGVCFSLTLVVIATCIPEAVWAGAPAKRALLVGCTKYPNLPEVRWLKGPGNDVTLLKSVLMSRFGFSKENTQTLAGWDGVPQQQRPTRANIEQAFQRLATEAGDGDIVVILMAGHGSQQVAAPGSAERPNVEPDGLDEIFLPADVDKWPGHDGAAQNVIVDNEVHQWLDAIRAKGAFVWIIFDSCNSGTMTRGVTDERLRHIDPEDLGISRAALDAARHRAATGAERTRGGDEEASGSMVEFGAGTGGYAALYAARPHELTPEVPLPRDVLGAKYYGLLTWTVCELLEQYGNRMTYRNLEQLIAQRYQGWPRYSPNPFAEGEKDRQVLGRERATKRSVLQIRKRNDGTLTVNGGALAGLTSNSVLAVYHTEAGGKEKLVGHVIVRGVDVTSAVVEPYQDASHQALDTQSLPEIHRCEIAVRDFGDMTIKLAVQASRIRGNREGSYHTLGASELPEQLVLALRVARKQAGKLFKVIDDSREADWVLEIVHDQVTLYPATGIALNTRGGVSESSVRRGPFPAANPTKLGQRLGQALQRIYRWRNLRRIAGQPAAPDSEAGEVDGDTFEPRMRVSLLRASGQTSGEWVRVSPGEKLYDGDHLRIKMENTGRVPLDVTLLVLDADFGIASLFPKTSEVMDNRLGPGQTLTLGTDPRSPVVVNVGDTAGPEYLIAIAVPAGRSRLPVEFSWLEQPALARAKSTAQTRGRGDSLQTPLGRLLATACYGEGGTRGLDQSNPGENAIFTILNWQTARR